MEVEEFIKRKKELYTTLFDYLESDEEAGEEYDSFISLIKNQDKKDSLELIKMLNKISENHQRKPLFFSKIIRLIQYIKAKQSTVTDEEIFRICSQNKYLLYFLFDRQIIVPQKSFMKDIFKNSYFFYNSIKPFIEKSKQQNIERKIFEKYENLETFNEKCKLGENDSYICSLIRQDAVEEFISHLHQFQISKSSKIATSMFETNSFLIDKTPTLMEYAAFFGSIEIFQYLLIENAKLTPSLWLYAIHGRNAEIIHFLEEYHVEPKDKSYDECIMESFKCHHDDISDYIIFNLLKCTKNGYEDNISDKLVSCILDNYNYNYLPDSSNYFFTTKYCSKGFMISQICSSIKVITIPKSITSIGNYAFEGCSSLEKVLIPSSVTNIGEYAFKGCTSLKEITLPSSIYYVGFCAFDIESLKITIQTTFPSYCLKGLKTKYLEIIGEMTIIPENFFADSTSLEQVKYPSTIKSIGTSAFKNCKSLKQISINPGITKIADSTFYQCESLEHIEIPSSVTLIGDSSFYNCLSLQQITIPSSVTHIGISAFRGCVSLQNIDIPSPVAHIGNSAFQGCTSLKHVTIPSSVTMIDYLTFANCSDLAEIIIPSSVTYIGNSAFYKCRNLTKIEIPSSVTEIQYRTFADCDKLKDVVLPPTLTIIGERSFENCYSLDSLKIPPSVKSIGFKAFP